MWEDLFKESLRYAKDKLPSAGMVALGYNTNIDAVVRLDTKMIERYLEKENVKEEEIRDMLEKPKGKIKDVRDFLCGILYYMNSGGGGEWLIEDKGTFEWLDSNMKGEYKMGGNCGIMSNVLSNLGVKVISHAISRCELQMRLYEGNNVYIATENGLKSPVDAIRGEDERMVHYIIEFRKGDTISIGKSKIVSPSANRFIATYDPANTRLDIDKSFRKEIVNNLDIIQSVILTGYHLLNKTNYRDRIRESINDILGWKRIKRDLLVHTEFADIHDKEMLRYYVEMMGSVVDSVGMNEDELESVCEVFERKMRDKHADTVFLNASWLFTRLGVKRLVVHTRKYSIALTKGNPEYERNALLFGCLGAATRAHKGNFSGIKDIEDTNVVLEIDEESIKEEDRLNKVVKLDNGIGRFKNGKVIFSPVKYCENPVNTVGLGDCFTACNIALISI